MDYSFSPNFNVEKGQFEHPEGDKSDKGIFDLFGLAFEFLGREDDEWEDRGFPVVSIRALEHTSGDMAFSASGEDNTMNPF